MKAWGDLHICCTLDCILQSTHNLSSRRWEPYWLEVFKQNFFPNLLTAKLCKYSKYSLVNWLNKIKLSRVSRGHTVWKDIFHSLKPGYIYKPSTLKRTKDYPELLQCISYDVSLPSRNCRQRDRTERFIFKGKNQNSVNRCRVSTDIRLADKDIEQLL